MLCKSILGASITNVPGVFTELGLIFGLIVFIIMTTVNIYSLLYITMVARETKSNGLEDIGQSIDKEKGKLFVTLSLLVMCMIPLIFYVIKSCYFISSFTEHYNMNISAKFVKIIVVIVCLSMCLVFKKADKLKYVNILGLASLSCLTMYTVYLFIQNYGNINFKSQKMFEVKTKAIEKISVVCFAFCSQFSILSITNNFESLGECKTVIVLGNVISLVVYLVTGLCGHLAAITYNTDDFFQSIEKNSFTEILKLTLAIVNILTFPLIMLATREAFHTFVPKRLKQKDSMTLKNVEIIFLVTLVYLISIPFDEYQHLLASTFFFAGSIVMFALPSYFYYRVMKHKLTPFTYVILCTNVLLTIFGFFSGVYILL